jgi:hypothetical protein
VWITLKKKMPHKHRGCCGRDKGYKHGFRDGFNQVNQYNYRPAAAYWPLYSGLYGWGAIYRSPNQVYYQNWQNPSFWGQQPIAYNPACDTCDF